MSDSASVAPRGPRGRPRTGGRGAILIAAEQLIAERGAARLTTKEVAQRGGISEGSIFYHFGDRAGLMMAVIEQGLDAFAEIAGPGFITGELRGNLDQFAILMDQFLDRSLRVVLAAQSDAQLRIGLADHMINNDLGPHRGITLLGQYLQREQAAGNVAPSVDCAAAAYLFYSACFQRAAQREMFGAAYGSALATNAEIVAAMTLMLRPE